MTDLQSKFSTFETQATNHHNALMARLQQTNDLLGDLIAALGGTPPTSTTTLADIASILSAIHADTMALDATTLLMRATLDNVHLDTISMDQKLLFIRNQIRNPTETLPQGDFGSIVNNLWRLAVGVGIVTENGNTLINQTSILDNFDYFRYYLPRTLGNLKDNQGQGDSYRSIMYLLQLLANGLGQDVDNTQLGVLLAQIVAQLGAPLNGETIAQLIADIGLNTTGLVTGLTPPTGAVNGSCTTDYKSTGMFLVPAAVLAATGVTDQTAPTWTDPPAQLRPGGYQAGQELFYIKPETGTWAGWHFYAESKAPLCARELTNTRRYPTNTWLDVGTDNEVLHVSVDKAYSLVVHLCAPGQLIGFGPGGGGGGPAGNSVTVNAAAYQLFRDGNLLGGGYAATLPLADHRTGGISGYASNNEVFHYDNPYNGWTVTVVSGRIRIFDYFLSGGIEYDTNAVFVFNTPGGHVFGIDDYVAGANRGAFTIRLDPPL